MLECRWETEPDLLIRGLDFLYDHAAQLRNDLEQINDLAALHGGNLKRLLGLTPGKPRQPGGNPNGLGVHQRRLLAKACPDPDLR